MNEHRYEAAHIKAEVEVSAYEKREDVGEGRFSRSPARRVVTLSFNEAFIDDEGLDAALDAFGAAVREAARR